MREICFGLALGMAIGMLVATNCDKVRTAVVESQQAVENGVKKAKKAIVKKGKQTADDEPDSSAEE